MVVLAKGVTKMSNEIKFGIRRSVLEDKTDRDFLKEYLATRDMSLTVITRIIDHCMVEIHSCVPSTYKPLDFTKLPRQKTSKEWQKAITFLIQIEKGSDVLWFDSETRAIWYIESTYTDSESEK